MSARRTNRSRRGYTITEFGAAFYAFCLVIVFPTICFLNFGVAFTYGFIASSLAADKVSQAMNFERADHVLCDLAQKMRSDSMAELIKIAPTDEPFKLELVKSNAKGEVRVIAYDTKKKLPSTGKDILQYRVTMNYTAKPLIDLAMVPFMNQIPIIGKATELSFQHLRVPEHAECLE